MNSTTKSGVGSFTLSWFVMEKVIVNVDIAFKLDTQKQLVISAYEVFFPQISNNSRISDLLKVRPHYQPSLSCYPTEILWAQLYILHLKQIQSGAKWLQRDAKREVYKWNDCEYFLVWESRSSVKHYKDRQNYLKETQNEHQDLCCVIFSCFVSLSVWGSCIGGMGNLLHVCVWPKSPIVSLSLHGCGIVGVTNSSYLLILLDIFIFYITVFKVVEINLLHM